MMSKFGLPLWLTVRQEHLADSLEAVVGALARTEPARAVRLATDLLCSQVFCNVYRVQHVYILHAVSWLVRTCRSFVQALACQAESSLTSAPTGPLIHHI